jgi:hypothetical protein
MLALVENRRRRALLSLLVGLFMMVAAGTIYGYPAYSQRLGAVLGFDQTQVRQHFLACLTLLIAVKSDWSGWRAWDAGTILRSHRWWVPSRLDLYLG